MRLDDFWTRIYQKSLASVRDTTRTTFKRQQRALSEVEGSRVVRLWGSKLRASVSEGEGHNYNSYNIFWKSP